MKGAGAHNEKPGYLKLVRIEHTRIVNDYLTIVNQEYINNMIDNSDSGMILLKHEMINYHNFPERIDNFRGVPVIDRDHLCNVKLCDHG